MRLSDDKISHLAHMAYDALIGGGAAELAAEDVKVRRELKAIIARHVRLEDEVDDRVRKTLASYSRNILEGSAEWDVLYRKHFQEEMDKLGES